MDDLGNGTYGAIGSDLNESEVDESDIVEPINLSTPGAAGASARANEPTLDSAGGKMIRSVKVP